MTCLRGALAMALWLTAMAEAHAGCKIDLDGEFPLQPDPSRVLIKGAVNEQPSVFIVDTGAWLSTMSVTAARKPKIHMDDGNAFQSSGVGGQVASGFGHFNMKLGGLTIRNEGFTVLGMKPMDHDDAPLVGRNLLAQHDLELDVPDNAIRMLEPHGCSADDLAYWNKPYSLTPLKSDGSRTPPILVDVKLNGHLVTAEIDSGFPQSTVTPAVVRGVNIATGTSIGDLGGIGPRRIAARVVRFDTFSIGEEVIHNAKLVVAEIWKYNKTEETGTRLGSTSADAWQPSMLLGADFLRAHRVFVSYSLGVLVFSYTGGPVFDISAKPLEAAHGGGQAGPR